MTIFNVFRTRQFSATLVSQIAVLKPERPLYPIVPISQRRIDGTVRRASIGFSAKKMVRPLGYSSSSFTESSVFAYCSVQRAYRRAIQ